MRLFFLSTILFLTAHQTHAQWVQLGTDILGEAIRDNSGRYSELAGNGQTIVIGAFFNDVEGTLNNAGHARVFDWNGSSWIQRGADINGTAAFEQAGGTVQISDDGNIVAVGSHRATTTNGNQSGRIRVFEWSGSAWDQKGADIMGEGPVDQVGLAMAMSADGDVIVFGSGGNDDGGFLAGHARVLEWNGSAWVQKGVDLDGAPNQVFGFAVAIDADGSTITASSTGGGSAAGFVRVFDWNGSAWLTRGTDIPNEASGDSFGTSMEFSDDGMILAVGAIQNDDGGLDAGHVRVFEWNGSTWTQRGSDIDGDAATDLFGRDVALSADGAVLAAGAPSNDSQGSNSGLVRVFDWTGSAWTQRHMNIFGSVGEQVGNIVSLSSDGQRLAASSSASNTQTGRSFILESQTSLPIQVADLDLIQSNESVLIRWQTLGQEGADRIDVEHRSDSEAWRVLGSIYIEATADKRERHQFLHEQVENGASYYRLALRDLDGSVSYSPVVTIEISFEINEIELYPNPTLGILNISNIEAGASVLVRSMDGKEVLDLKMQGPQIDLSNLAPGVYFLETRLGNRTLRKVFIKG